MVDNAGAVEVDMPTVEQLLIEIREGQAAHRESVARALESFTAQSHEQALEIARYGERLEGAVADIRELREAVAKLQPSATQHGINAAGGGIGGAIVLGLMALWERITKSGP